MAKDPKQPDARANGLGPPHAYTPPSLFPPETPGPSGPLPSDPSDPSDPIQELFGPGSGTFYHTPDEDENAPEELISLFDEYGISEYKYRCQLREATDAGEWNYLGSRTESYPSIDYITNNYGPGKYQLYFSWKANDPATGRMKSVNKRVTITISDKCLDQFINYTRKKKIAAAQKARMEIQQAQVERAIDAATSGADGMGGSPPLNGAPIDTMEAGKKFVQQTREAAALLGFGGASSTPLPPSERGIDWKMLIPLIPALLEFFGKQRDREEARSKEMLALIMSINKTTNEQMMEALRTASGSNAASKAVEDYQRMLTGVIDLKTELSGMGKKSAADRIFELLESLAPHVTALLAMPMQKRLADPRAGAAQMFATFSPDVQAIRVDHAEQMRLVSEMDAYYGWEQTDAMIEFMKLGFLRPAECPRRPDQRFPSGDQRNAVCTSTPLSDQAPPQTTPEAPKEPAGGQSDRGADEDAQGIEL